MMRTKDRSKDYWVVMPVGKAPKIENAHGTQSAAMREVKRIIQSGASAQSVFRIQVDHVSNIRNALVAEKPFRRRQNLTDKKRKEIVAALKRGDDPLVIATSYGTSASCIYNIRHKAGLSKPRKKGEK